jgi:hypothetical protein
MRGTMFRAEVEPMPTNPPERVPYTGLWKVVIYEGDRFVRTERDLIAYPEDKRLARELNGWLNIKSKSAGR